MVNGKWLKYVNFVSANHPLVIQMIKVMYYSYLFHEDNEVVICDYGH
jgi:hypothetical protein